MSLVTRGLGDYPLATRGLGGGERVFTSRKGNLDDSTLVLDQLGDTLLADIQLVDATLTSDQNTASDQILVDLETLLAGPHLFITDFLVYGLSIADFRVEGVTHTTLGLDATISDQTSQASISDFPAPESEADDSPSGNLTTEES